jgi:O-antigen ligase
LATITIPAYCKAPAQRPAWHLVVAWAILLPLLFFSTSGNLTVPSGDAKVGMIASSDGLLSHRLPTALTLLICSVLILSRFRLVWSMSKHLKVVLALPALAILSCAWSTDPRQSVVSGCVLAVFTLFAFYLAGNFTPRRQLELILLAGAVIVPLSIAVALLLPDIGTTSSGWRGILGHKNNLSMVVTLMLITALHWTPRGWYQKTLRATYILMCLPLIAMAQSREGWALGCLAVFLSIVLRTLQRMKAKESAAVALATVPFLLSGAYIIYEFSGAILETLGKDPTLTQRTVIWAAAWEAVTKQALLGYGYSAFWTGLQGPSQDITLIAGWSLQQAQNGFLDLWLQLGIASMAIIALMVALAAKDAGRSFRRSPHSAYVRWCIVVLFCTFVYNIGESTLGLPRLTWFMVLIACVGLSQTAQAGRSTPLADELEDGT